jgi:hypothetical protein
MIKNYEIFKKRFALLQSAIQKNILLMESFDYCDQIWSGPKWSHLSGSSLNSLLFQRMLSRNIFLTLLAFCGFVSIEANEIKSSRYQLPCKNNCSLNGGSYLYCETEQGWDYCSLQPGKSWAMILIGLG